MIDLLKNKPLFIINTIFLALIIVFDICLMAIGEPYIFKTIASVLFVLCGVVNVIFIAKSKLERNKFYKYLMLVGLVFACLGDIFLINGDTFIVGAALFAVGHVFFFVAYSLLYKLNWRDLIISLAIFAVALVVILVPQIFDFRGMLPVVLVYAFIISFMMGKAISNVFKKDYRAENIWIMIGSILFFLSDLMLLFDLFASNAEIFDIMCLSLYYPAEFLLASSIFYANTKSEEITAEKAKNEKNV